LPQPLPGIEHIILLMFENRSFDNMLGAFYPGSKNRGGVPTGWSNPYQENNIAAWQAPAGSTAQTISLCSAKTSTACNCIMLGAQFQPSIGWNRTSRETWRFC